LKLHTLFKRSFVIFLFLSGKKNHFYKKYTFKKKEAESKNKKKLKIALNECEAVKNSLSKNEFL